jgi:hypothetical protein
LSLPENERARWVASFPKVERAYDLFASWGVIRDWKEVLVPGSHTVSHPCLDKCDAARIETECALSASAIESNTGVLPLAFAPPFGRISPAAGEICSRHYPALFGTVMGVNVSGKTGTLLKRFGPRPGAPDSSYLLPRIAWYSFKEGVR